MTAQSLRQLQTYFNSRPSARGDHRCGGGCGRWGNFNSRPSARGDAAQPASPMFCSFQFTPLREGRRDGAQVLRLRQISIHAPPRGATPTAAAYGARSTGFQFTPLREGRLIRISFVVESSLFQFTPLREGRPCVRARMVTYWDFNSRPSARGDTRRLLISSSRNYFNSRPSARGDTGGGGTVKNMNISIHAPPRGATVIHLFYDQVAQFQFTPLREGRRQKICNFCKSFVQPLQISMA